MLKIFSKKKQKTREVKPGRLIVLDGIDGSGKTVQADLLAATLKIEGYNVKQADFPRYWEESTYFVKKYLNGEYNEKLDPRAAAVFYTLDRFDASFKIKEWLEKGYIVICNRYISANLAHHGGKYQDKGERLKFFKWLNELEYEIFHIPKPDLTIIFQLPTKIAETLIDQKAKTERQYIKSDTGKDIHELNSSHLESSNITFKEIAQLLPKTKLVECSENGGLLAPNLIHNRVWDLVRRIVLKDLPPQEIKL